MNGVLAFVAGGVLCGAMCAATHESRVERVERPAIAVLGASASAGFGVLVVGPGGDGPGAVGTRLSEIVLAIDEPPPVVVRDWSTASFFTNPLEIGPEAVRRCLDGSPDAILAIDFLFWFAYGAYDAQGERIVDEAQRDGLFEFGLSLLESIDVPILVGDLPDVRGANPRMLSRWQVPSVETLERLNARLRAWADAKPHVRIFPLSERTRIALEDRGPPKSRDASTGPREEAAPQGRSPSPPPLQRDRLHPTFDGLVLITQAAVRTMGDLPASARLVEAMATTESEVAGRADEAALAERIRQRILSAETRSAAERPSTVTP